MSQNLFQQALKEEGITGKLADLAWSIYSQESGKGRNTKTSNAGAVGGMQIIPSTFKSVADKDWDINDPLHNARAGIRYLSQLNKQAGGDPALTAAGYYGGPGGMEKARKGVAVSDPRNPKAPNTLQYAEQVVGRMPGGGVKVASQVPVGRQPDGSINPVGGGSAEPVVVAEAPPPRDLSQAYVQPPEVLPASVALGPVDNSWQDFLKTLQPARGDVPVQPQDLMYGPAPVEYVQAKVNAPSGKVDMGSLLQQPNRNVLARARDFIDMSGWGRVA